MSAGSLQKLFDIIARLRGRDGCPWDREQKADSILSDLIEEAYELQWAYAQGDKDDTIEELGDVVFVLTFAITLLQEQYPGLSLESLTTQTHDKIHNRHPHVFGDAVARTKAEGLAHWERMKQKENARKTNRSGDIFADVPGNFSPIRRAEELQRRAARTGFDWQDTNGIFSKIREELEELERELPDASGERAGEELGDLIFSVLNLARFLDIDSEKALTATNHKFILRYNRMKQLAEADGAAFDDLTLEQMDGYWERAKNERG